MSYIWCFLCVRVLAYKHNLNSTHQTTMNNSLPGKSYSRLNYSDSKAKNENARKSSATKIDPQVYTDTLSKGLSSRVVLYYDRSNHGGAAARSPHTKPIVNRMYNRVGDFPVVHFNKNCGTEETLKRFRSSGSIASSSGHIKIPAPGKCESFHKNRNLLYLLFSTLHR